MILTALLTGLIAPAVGITLAVAVSPRLYSIARGSIQSRSQLGEPPTRTNWLTIITILNLIALKYSIRLLGQRIGLAKPLRADSAGTYKLPLQSVTAPIIATDDDVAKYRRAVSPKRHARPNTVSQGDKHGSDPIFLLATLTTPLLLHLLCKSTNAILPLGAVNVRNRFEFLDPHACRSVRHGQYFRAEARLGGPQSPGRQVKRGMEFDVVIEVALAHGADKGRVIFRQFFTVLQIIKAKRLQVAGSESKAVQSEGAGRAVDGETELRVDFNAPGRYAAVCKDYNPIHVSSIAAKLFGFPGKIAHGNLVVAMAMEQASSSGAVANAAAAALGQIWTTATEPSWLQVDFKRPMVVPTTLTVKWARDGAEIVSRKRGQEKVHVQMYVGNAEGRGSSQ